MATDRCPTSFVANKASPTGYVEVNTDTLAKDAKTLTTDEVAALDKAYAKSQEQAPEAEVK